MGKLTSSIIILETIPPVIDICLLFIFIFQVIPQPVNSNDQYGATYTEDNEEDLETPTGETLFIS